MFSIDEINGGWLNVTLEFGDDVYCIMGTDIWGTDSGLQIVKMCADALNESGSFYAVLDNEPGAWVIELSSEGRLCIYLCREDLKGNPDMTQCEKAFETGVDISEFSEAVCDAFSEYSNGGGRTFYEKESHTAFPTDEFERLKTLLKK